MKKALLLSILLFSTLTFQAGATALNNEDFTSCTNPTGTVVASYANGTHGVVGDLTTHTGSDTVYTNGESNFTQCFCSDSGSGIQTNWMYAGNLTSDQIKTYESKGYIYVPDGSSWGLNEGPYLAKNISYSCKGKTDGSSSNSNSSSGHVDSASADSGSTTNAFTNFASTGNIVFIYSVFSAAVVLFFLGFYIKRFK